MSQGETTGCTWAKETFAVLDNSGVAVTSASLVPGQLVFGHCSGHGLQDFRLAFCCEQESVLVGQGQRPVPMVCVPLGQVWLGLECSLLPAGSNKDWGNPGSGACRAVMGGQ